MIFPFCSVYSTCRCHFSLQSYCLGEWSSTAMLTGRGLNDSFPQIRDLGISLTPPSVWLCLRPSRLGIAQENLGLSSRCSVRSLPYRPHSAVF